MRQEKSSKSGEGRNAFTLVELLVVIAIIGVLIGLLLPAVQAAREAGRRSQCLNQVRQIAIALQTYHSAHNAVPATHSWLKAACDAENTRWSAMAQLLPYMEQEARYEAISEAMLPYTWSQHASLQGTLAVLICPSDGGGRSLENTPTNYGFSCGDYMNDCHAPSGESYRRMAMSPRQWGSFARIGDGTSNTVAVSELVVATEAASRNIKGGMAQVADVHDGPMGKCGLSVMTDAGNRQTFKSSVTVLNNNHPAEPQQAFRGGRFYDGRPSYTGFHTITPPNSPACAEPNTNGDNANSWLMPPTSFHPGGVNVAMFDASARFVSDTIDCAGATAGQKVDGESPYGVWGAVGSPNGKETKSLP